MQLSKLPSELLEEAENIAIKLRSESEARRALSTNLAEKYEVHTLSKINI